MLSSNARALLLSESFEPLFPRPLSEQIVSFAHSLLISQLTSLLLRRFAQLSRSRSHDHSRRIRRCLRCQFTVLSEAAHLDIMTIIIRSWPTELEDVRHLHYPFSPSEKHR